MLVNNFITLDLAELSQREWRKLLETLTFINEAGAEVTVYRRLVDRGAVRLARGSWYLLPDHVEYDDRRTCPPMPEVNCTIELDVDDKFQGQQDALDAMMIQEQGLIIRPPGSGKTQIALAFAAKAKTRTLVIVNTNDLLQQWVDYAEASLPDIEIGIIQGKKEQVAHLTIATIQSLYRSGYDRKFFSQFGAVILDEAHHGPAESFELVLNQIPARYRFGFTATETRADGMHPAMKFLIGPVIATQKFGSKVPVTVKPLRSGFHYPYRGAFDWPKLLGQLEIDEDRNALIAKEADRLVREGHSVLILSRRITHLRMISEAMETFDEFGEFLVGAVEDTEGHRRNLSKAEREKVIKKFRSGKVRVVLATHLADEGLDIPRLDRVILTFPGKHSGRLIQQVGRTLREHPDKVDAQVIDIVDRRVRPLHRQWNERKRWYKKARISIESNGNLLTAISIKKRRRHGVKAA
jgi:superfamily II DNA or RNA helicase